MCWPMGTGSRIGRTGGWPARGSGMSSVCPGTQCPHISLVPPPTAPPLRRPHLSAELFQSPPPRSAWGSKQTLCKPSPAQLPPQSISPLQPLGVIVLGCKCDHVTSLQCVPWSQDTRTCLSRACAASFQCIRKPLVLPRPFGLRSPRPGRVLLNLPGDPSAWNPLSDSPGRQIRHGHRFSNTFLVNKWGAGLCPSPEPGPAPGCPDQWDSGESHPEGWWPQDSEDQKLPRPVLETRGDV